MANGARAEGIDANLFFTFFGLDAVLKERHDHIKVTTVGIRDCISPPGWAASRACRR